jgi:hypothetical protein
MDPILLAVVPGAIGYSLLYLLFGGGLTGAIIIFFLARALGR